MYKRSAGQVMLPDEFMLPFSGSLDPENRWIKIASVVPWWEIEERYAHEFSDNARGRQANSARAALGALIIRSRLGVSDAETVRLISENPYMQYLIGMPAFSNSCPFSARTISRFRKRIGEDTLHSTNVLIDRALKRSKG